MGWDDAVINAGKLENLQNDPGASPSGAAEEFRGLVALPGLMLQSGRTLPGAVHAYARYGELNETRDNVVLLCHALTGSHHVAGTDAPGLPGAWWDALVGPHRALDTSRYCVFCFNILGSPYGSTSPVSPVPETGVSYGMHFPVITVRDMVEAQRIALEQLGVRRIAAVVGGSLGGMQALEWLLSHPDRVDRCAVVAAPWRLYPQAIAFNEVQRQAIMADPAWQGGAYPPGEGPRKGLSVARMLAMITYRSEQVFVDRWMRSVARGNPLEWEGQFQVESYLHHQGESLVRRFDANCYLYLSRAMDLHDAGEGRSPEFLRSALAGKHLLAVGIGSDLLFPNWQVEELSRLAADRGAHATYEEIESDHGHDAFLIDVDQVDEMLRRFWRSSGL